MNALLLVLAAFLPLAASFNFTYTKYSSTANCASGTASGTTNLVNAAVSGNAVCFKVLGNAETDYIKHVVTCGSATANYTRLDWSSCNSDCSLCLSNSTVVSKSWTHAEWTNLAAGSCNVPFMGLDPGDAAEKFTTGASSYACVCGGSSCSAGSSSSTGTTSGASQLGLSVVSLCVVALALRLAQ